MTRYIDADALIKDCANTVIIAERLKEYDISRIFSAMLDTILSQPTIDAEPVLHGKWIEKSTGGEHFDCCSKCGYVEWDAPTNYCPNCGADMREES